MIKKVFTYLIIITIALPLLSTNDSAIKLALLKYNGGGDWYANPSSLPNLAKFCNKNISTNLDSDYAIVEAGSTEIFNYPYIHITGHGNIVFNQFEAENLRNYLLAGGFLHISDNYGLDKFIRPQMKKVFPELDFIEIPFSHPIFHQKYDFDNGLPKIHLHDNSPPQAYGLIYQGRLVCFYDYECDLGDGWEDEEIHNDPYNKREKALQMGANIISYAFTLDNK